MSDLAKMLKDQAGIEEEEITDEQIAAAIIEVLASKTEGGEKEKRNVLRKETTKALTLAARTIKFAVSHDGSGDVEGALREYDEALGLYAECLNDEVLGVKPAEQIVASMASYLDRCLALRLDHLEDPEYADAQPQFRGKAVEAMGRRGFSTLKRGVALFKRAKDAPSGTVSDWQTLVLFQEALECLMAYLRAPGTKSPMVQKCVVEMLDRSEELKSAMKAAEAAPGAAQARAQVANDGGAAEVATPLMRSDVGR